MQIEHDGMAQKFTGEIDGEECFLAYTLINDDLNIHVMFVPDGAEGDRAAEELATAAFEFARKTGVKIISSSAYIDNIFLKKHPEYAEFTGEW